MIVALAGCGRLGFDPGAPADAALDDGADAGTDANPLDVICGSSDSDGDGIGDACDPSGAVAHEVALYEPFDTLPPWTTTGAGIWTVTAGGLHGMYTDLSASSFVAPGSFDPPLTVIVRYTIDELDSNGTTNFTISAVDAFDLPTEDSQKCGQASPSRLAIGYEMAGTTVDASNVAFPDSLKAGATYVTTFDHSAATMTCTTEVPALGPTATVSIQHAPWRSSGNVGVRIRSIAATFHWLLVITPK